MNKQILILAGGAGVVVLIIAILVAVMLGGQKPAPVVEDGPAPVAKEYVLVAAEPLKRGHELGPNDLRWKELPPKPDIEALQDPLADRPRTAQAIEDISRQVQDAEQARALPPGAITTTNDSRPTDSILKGRLRRSVAEDEPVTKADVAQGNNIVSISLEPGERAVTIEVNAQASVGGFVWPGDYVDVVLVYKQERMRLGSGRDNASADLLVARTINKVGAETIIQNARVLAVDQDATSPPVEEGRVGKTLTLAVTAQEAEVVALAQEMGDLTLALRGLGDDAPVDRAWGAQTDARLLRVDDEIVQEYLQILNQQGQAQKPITVYEGGEVKE